MSIPANVQSTDTFLTWRNITNILINSFSDRSEHAGAPTAFDDSNNTSGNGTFRTGSVWIDTVAKDIYFCKDATAGSAVWEKNDLLSGHLANGDPHPQYATDADLSAHILNADPHPQYQLDINWQTISADITATKNDGFFVDTSASIITVTLPLAPSLNDIIFFEDVKGRFSVNNLIIARNGELLMGLAEDMTVGIDYISFALVYSGATNGWRIV